MFYAGSDTFESYQAAKQKAAELAVGSVELRVMDAPPVSEFQLALQGCNLWSQPAVVLLKRPLAERELSSFLQKLDIQKYKHNLVLWHDDKVDRRSSLVKGLESANLLVEYNLPNAAEFSKWIGIWAKSVGIKLQSGVTDLIMQEVGMDKWGVTSELRKYYLAAKGGMVTTELVKQVCAGSLQSSIWELIDTLGKGVDNWRQLESMLTREDVTQYILTMLSRELSLLTIYKLGGDRAVKLPEFAKRKLRTRAAKYDLDKIRRLAYALLRLDLSIKQGKLDSRSGLMLYLLSW